MTDAEIRRIEAQWKSDVDRKLDALTVQLAELNSILAIGKGGVALTFFMAKAMAALGVIGAGMYALKAWILKV